MALLAGLIEVGEVVLQQIAHAQAVTAGLVGIGRADALERRANLGLAHGAFAGGIQGPVGGHNQVCTLGDEQFLAHVHAAGFNLRNLVQQNHGINDHAVADNVHGSLAENAGRNGVKHKAVAVKYQRVTGVGTALEAGNHFVGGSEHIHYFAFAFVAPLEAEYYI